MWSDQIFDVMKVFRYFGNQNRGKYLLIPTMMVFPIYWYARDSGSVDPTESYGEDRMRDLDREIMASTSGKEWESRGMSIR